MICHVLRHRPVAGHRTLAPGIVVRLHVPECVVKTTALLSFAGSLACVDKTQDGRVIRHSCTDGHYIDMPMMIGKTVVLTPEYICDREIVDTLPAEHRRPNG